ncbi:MAG: sulfotransferase, partial [Woeseiaceae bacterium]|nr:sulfotransferase [Woeseiaceae bacterium]
AWPLFRRASELQPDATLFRANLASCAVYVGEIDAAREAFEFLLEKNPTHQRNHYQLARLSRATDTTHIEQMEKVLRDTNLPPDRNIFLYYALGKEYEDLEEWDTAFDWYKKGGDAVMTVADYNIMSDLSVIDAVIANCTADWIARSSATPPPPETPLFVVGLPRTGTTLTERILASHSRVQSVGETEFIQMTLRRESKVKSVERMNATMINAVADMDPSILSHGYVDTLRYRLTDEPIFVDKLPFNVLYLGFIARAWPDRPVVLLNRHPMDACFAMYKQVFTWAYKFSYDLDNLANYYIAYRNLVDHWRDVLGERLVEIDYEDLVSDQEGQTRRLLDRVGLDFEEACLHFDRNTAPTTTASSVQVREKVHTESIGKWKHFEKHLAPLADKLRASGIPID